MKPAPSIWIGEVDAYLRYSRESPSERISWRASFDRRAPSDSRYGTYRQGDCHQSRGNRTDATLERGHLYRGVDADSRSFCGDGRSGESRILGESFQFQHARQFCILSIITGETNFDNRKNIQWDNRFEWRTGLSSIIGNTTQSDDQRRYSAL